MHACTYPVPSWLYEHVTELLLSTNLNSICIKSMNSSSVAAVLHFFCTAHILIPLLLCFLSYACVHGSYAIQWVRFWCVTVYIYYTYVEVTREEERADTVYTVHKFSAIYNLHYKVNIPVEDIMQAKYKVNRIIQNFVSVCLQLALQ